MNLKVLILLGLIVISNAGVVAPPSGLSQSESTQDDAGNYEFEYNISDPDGAVKGRSESGDEYGNKRGSYYLTDVDGRSRRVDYVADEYGFRATVNTNEPGTMDSSPASTAFYSTSPEVVIKTHAKVVEPAKLLASPVIAPAKVYTPYVDPANVIAPAVHTKVVSPAYTAPLLAPASVYAPHTKIVTPAYATHAKVISPAFHTRVVSPAFAAPAQVITPTLHTKVIAPTFASPAFRTKVIAPAYAHTKVVRTHGIPATYVTPPHLKVLSPAYTAQFHTPAFSSVPAYATRLRSPAYFARREISRMPSAPSDSPSFSSSNGSPDEARMYSSSDSRMPLPPPPPPPQEMAPPSRVSESMVAMTTPPTYSESSEMASSASMNSWRRS